MQWAWLLNTFINVVKLASRTQGAMVHTFTEERIKKECHHIAPPATICEAEGKGLWVTPDVLSLALALALADSEAMGPWQRKIEKGFASLQSRVQTAAPPATLPSPWPARNPPNAQLSATAVASESEAAVGHT